MPWRWIAVVLFVANAAAAQERVDYLTFAQGAVPVAIGGAGAKLDVTYERAVRIIDGSPVVFVVVNQAAADTDTEFTYELPALTRFDRFAVPNIIETPAPNQTFAKRVEVHGSAESATAGFSLLAAGDLQPHKTRGLVTELAINDKKAVKWVRVRLVGGLAPLTPRMSIEFSEIIGNGTQEAAPLSTRFTGAWRAGSQRLHLRQQGAVVSGCYDGSGVLSGTVSGNILRATGSRQANKIPAAFIMSVTPEGAIRGVRSDNKGPFAFTTMAAAPDNAAPDCPPPPPPTLGCGAIIHGITFAFDSAELRPESAAILTELHKGLQADASSAVVIEGHTSDEGSTDYNLKLSERRAQAVVDDLVKRGLAKGRLTAAGLGESRPLASNADESGRAINRRVAIVCK